MQVAVSAVIFAMRPATDGRLHLWLPLVRRTRPPFENQWALPGGWVGRAESLTDAAGRTLAETTGLRPGYLEQLYTFGRPDRSPDGRVISVVYSALLHSDQSSAPLGDQSSAPLGDQSSAPLGDQSSAPLGDQSSEENENVRWFRADELAELAFDHNDIIEYALWRLRNKIEYAHVAFFFLGETFSMSQLREVYEAILEKRLDPANFRRQIEATGTIVPTSERLTGGRHRPPRLYRCDLTVDAMAVGPAA